MLKYVDHTYYIRFFDNMPNFQFVMHVQGSYAGIHNQSFKFNQAQVCLSINESSILSNNKQANICSSDSVKSISVFVNLYFQYRIGLNYGLVFCTEYRLFRSSMSYGFSMTLKLLKLK
jgi:hypothetical protein